MKITYITSNSSKAREAEQIAKDYGFEVIIEDLSIDEVKSLNQAIISETYAKSAYQLIKRPLIVDDTGLYLEGFNNFPGAYTKFMIKTIGMAAMFKLVDNKDTKATWQCYATYIDSKKIITSVGQLKGIIKIPQAKSDQVKSNYDSVFIPSGCNKPIGDFSIYEKGTFSHRRKALDKIFKELLLDKGKYNE